MISPTSSCGPAQRISSRRRRPCSLTPPNGCRRLNRWSAMAAPPWPRSWRSRRWTIPPMNSTPCARSFSLQGARPCATEAGITPQGLERGGDVRRPKPAPSPSSNKTLLRHLPASRHGDRPACCRPVGILLDGPNPSRILQQQTLPINRHTIDPSSGTIYRGGIMQSGPSPPRSLTICMQLGIC